MRSREPWRLPAGQSRAVPFLQAAVLFAALCIFARSAALVLAAFLAAPVPAAQTLLHLGQQAVESRARLRLRKACRRTCPRPLRRRKLTSRCRPGWSSILWRCSRTKPALPMPAR